MFKQNNGYFKNLQSLNNELLKEQYRDGIVVLTN